MREETRACKKCRRTLSVDSFAPNRHKCKECRRDERRKGRPTPSEHCVDCGCSRSEKAFNTSGSVRCRGCAYRRRKLIGERVVYIQAEPIIGAMKQWVSQQSGTAYNPQPTVAAPEVAAAMSDLSNSTGLTKDTLYRIMTGRRKTISFDNADKITTALECNEIWHTDPVLASIKTVS